MRLRCTGGPAGRAEVGEDDSMTPCECRADDPLTIILGEHGEVSDSG
jgi:hypothetical protein